MTGGDASYPDFSGGNSYETDRMAVLARSGAANDSVRKLGSIHELRRHPERAQHGLDSDRFHLNYGRKHHGQRSEYRDLLDRRVGKWKSANGLILYVRRNLHDYGQRNERYPQWRDLYRLFLRAGYLDASYTGQWHSEL